MRIYLLLFVTAMAALSSPAAAQVIDPYSTDYFTKVTWDDINRRTSEQAKQAQPSAAQSTPQRTPPKKATPKKAAARPTALNFQPTGSLAQSRGVNVLVAQYQGEQQAAMRTNYVAMISSFNDSVPRLYGVQKNNLATGTAALLTGAYVAYNNRPFADAWVKPLVQQLESTMASDASLANAPNLDKETAYQVMVGTGMVLQVTQAELAKSPDAHKAAELRKAGAEVFRVMGIAEPSRVQFSQAGISFR